MEVRAEQSLGSADALKGSHDVQRERHEPIVIDVGQLALGLRPLAPPSAGAARPAVGWREDPSASRRAGAGIERAGTVTVRSSGGATATCDVTVLAPYSGRSTEMTLVVSPHARHRPCSRRIGSTWRMRSSEVSKITGEAVPVLTARQETHIGRSRMNAMMSATVSGMVAATIASGHRTAPHARPARRYPGRQGAS